MEAELDPGIKSRPRYQSVALKDKAGFSLFVVEEGQESSLDSLYQSCSGGKLLLSFKLSDLSDYSSKEFDRTVCPEELAEAFAGLPLSAQIYVSGSEAFLWDVQKLALAAGLLAEQVNLSQPTTSARRVFCTHCYTVMENVLYSPVTCSGCGLPLMVRDHFSRPLGAYVGLNINAEDGAEIPQEEALK